MSTNRELARVFDDMAAVLELLGENPFRVNAHARVARVLEELSTDVAGLADDRKQLTAIDGIGEGSAKKIIEYVRTGRVGEHEELLARIPTGLLDVMHLPGMGPKKVRTLWQDGGVTDMESLKTKLTTDELEALPRMGRKTIQNLREAIDFAAKSAERTRLGVALPLADALVERLRAVGGTRRIEYAGSLRRGRETIGDIDLVAATTQPLRLAEAFCEMPGVTKVLARGETKCSIRVDDIQIDLRIVPESACGAALLYFTGSKDHNVRLRERAQRAGLRLNEYGLFPDDGEQAPPQDRGIKPVAAKTEESIYKRLGLPWIPPELREDRGEFDVDMPALIDLDDIRAELHAHTVASDGALTIDELAAEAKRRGFHTIAVTDHSKSSIQANGLSPDRLRAHIDAVHEANGRVKGITILAGSEVDILADGRLDYDDDLLAELDIVVASPHTALKQDPDKATQRLLRAIHHPLVHILGHPTGRIINRREGLHPDINALVEAAVEHDTALELNANYHRLDLRDAHIRTALQAGAKVAIDTDAHGVSDFNQLRYGILTARRGWLPAAQCINTWSRQKLHAWLKSTR